jgi:hypothetical protein
MPKAKKASPKAKAPTRAEREAAARQKVIDDRLAEMEAGLAGAADFYVPPVPADQAALRERQQVLLDDAARARRFNETVSGFMGQVGTQAAGIARTTGQGALYAAGGVGSALGFMGNLAASAAGAVGAVGSYIAEKNHEINEVIRAHDRARFAARAEAQREAAIREAEAAKAAEAKRKIDEAEAERKRIQDLTSRAAFLEQQHGAAQAHIQLSEQWAREQQQRERLLQARLAHERALRDAQIRENELLRREHADLAARLIAHVRATAAAAAGPAPAPAPPAPAPAPPPAPAPAPPPAPPRESRGIWDWD